MLSQYANDNRMDRDRLYAEQLPLPSYGVVTHRQHVDVASSSKHLEPA